MDTRQYLEGLLCQPAEVDKWLSGEAFPFSKYDPELGFLHRTRRRHDGVDDSTPVYTSQIHHLKKCKTSLEPAVKAGYDDL